MKTQGSSPMIKEAMPSTTITAQAEPRASNQNPIGQATTRRKTPQIIQPSTSTAPSNPGSSL
jgi:hypothetical protein